MKALLLFVMVLSVLLTLCACGKESTITETDYITRTINQTQTITQPPQIVPPQIVTETVTSTITKTSIPAEDGFIRITCEEVASTPYYIAFDARTGVGIYDERLPATSYWIRFNKLNQMSVEEIRSEFSIIPRKSILVFYDWGEETSAAYLAQQVVDLNEELTLGFNVEDIRILEGGFGKWQALYYPTDEG